MPGSGGGEAATLRAELAELGQRIRATENSMHGKAIGRLEFLARQLGSLRKRKLVLERRLNSCTEGVCSASDEPTVAVQECKQQ